MYHLFDIQKRSRWISKSIRKKFSYLYSPISIHLHWRVRKEKQFFMQEKEKKEIFDVCQNLIHSSEIFKEILRILLKATFVVNDDCVGGKRNSKNLPYLWSLFIRLRKDIENWIMVIARIWNYVFSGFLM